MQAEGIFCHVENIGCTAVCSLFEGSNNWGYFLVLVVGFHIKVNVY